MNRMNPKSFTKKGCNFLPLTVQQEAICRIGQILHQYETEEKRFEPMPKKNPFDGCVTLRRLLQDIVRKNEEQPTKLNEYIGESCNGWVTL